ncbi:MAG: sel1 repeat family protein [Campylobacteraceae bacterium]|jgi:TPR repeat protein|nr:sel1 repeat family protein [Campylobacteraceae bacterium]
MSIFGKIFWVLAAVLLLGMFAAADDLSDGTEAFRIGDYEKSAELFQKACDKGDAYSCSIFGFMYSNGIGVRQDYFKAVELYKKACSGGDARGCNNLGVMYKQGKGVRKDIDKALDYYGKACDLKEQKGCENYAKLKK